MKNDVFWFTHDANATDDEKIMMLIDQLGLEGYGIYWVLIEKLRGTDNFKLSFSIVPILARRYNTTAEKMLTVIKQYSLFKYDDEGFFFSPSLINRMQKWIDKREKNSIAGKISAQKRLLSSSKHKEMQQVFNTCSTSVQLEQNRIEQNRIKEIDTIVSKKNDDSSKEKHNANSEENINYKEVLDKWKELCPMLAQPRMLDAKRKKKIASLLKNNNATMDDLYNCFSIIASSTICNGGKGWMATFDWLINDTKSCFNGLLEGKYSFFNNSEKLAYKQIIGGKALSADTPKEQKIVIDGIEYK